MSLCVQGCVCRAACARRLRVWLDVHLRTHGCDCVWPREWMLTGHLCAWRREGWGQTDREGAGRVVARHIRRLWERRVFE